MSCCSTNVRAHNRSLGAEGVPIETLDHDWNICGLVPSVVLLCEVPDSVKSSFVTARK